MSKLVKLMISAMLAGALLLTPAAAATAQAAGKTAVDTQASLTAKAVVPTAMNGMDTFSVKVSETEEIELPLSEEAFVDVQDRSYSIVMKNYPSSALAKAIVQEWYDSQDEYVKSYTQIYRLVGFDAGSAAAYAKRAYGNEILGLTRAQAALSMQGK